jgi:GNAT superfamily N-acetyltransferase
VKEDFENVRLFVDKWLSGHGPAIEREGGGNDYFVSKQQHRDYFKSQHVYIALDGKKIIGWGVKEKTNILIHLLIDANYRGKGIGQKMMKIINPMIVRSKSDQSTGDPKKFYEKLSYKSVTHKKVGRKKNIELLIK